MKENALLFAFDNPNQLKYLRFALLTLPKTNLDNFDILLMINQRVSEDEEFKSFIKENSDIKINIHLVEEKELTGMFYWMMAPLIFDYRKIIQLDVDMVFGPKTNFINLLNENKDSEKAFSGIEVKLTNAPNARKIINHYLKTNDEDIVGKDYINSGVVIIDVESVKKISEYSDKEILLNSLKSYIAYCKNNDLKITDQEYLFINFNEHFAFINNNWNIRFFSKKDIVDFDNNKDYVFHYNIKILNWITFKLGKVNYTKYLDKSIEKRNYKIFVRTNKRYMKTCKPSYWFPFKSFTKIGKRDKALFKSLAIISKEISESAMKDIYN